jgi:hypothetical protein
MGTEGEQMKSDHCARDPYASAQNLSAIILFGFQSPLFFLGEGE